MKTCYDLLTNDGTRMCEKCSCKNYVRCSEHQNCINVAIAKFPHGMILEDIGKIIGVSRMRVCQLQKDILLKIRNQSNELS